MAENEKEAVQTELLEEEVVTFTCINNSMTLLLGDNLSHINFENGIYIARGDEHIAAIRAAIKSSGYKSRFSVVDRNKANEIIKGHQAAMSAVAITGPVGSQSDNVQGPGARLHALAQMREAGVDVETEAAKAVLNAIAPEPNQPVDAKGLKTEAASILKLGDAAAEKTGKPTTNFFTKKDS